MIDAHVLSSFEVRLDGRSIVPRPNKPRQVLALLVLEAPRMVSIDALIDELWGGLPPRSALTTLQTYVMQLRRAITEASPGEVDAKDVLQRNYAGYQLQIDPESVDINVFRARVAIGMRALAAGDPQAASECLTEALSTWFGEPLTGVEHGRRLGVEATRMKEDALTAQLARVDAELALGRHDYAVGDLGALSVHHPLDERICVKYMIACYRSGRPHQALEAYARIRRTLVTELGLDPSARVRAVQQQILDADPGLDWSSTSTHGLLDPHRRAVS